MPGESGGFEVCSGTYFHAMVHRPERGTCSVDFEEPERSCDDCYGPGGSGGEGGVGCDPRCIYDECFSNADCNEYPHGWCLEFAYEIQKCAYGCRSDSDCDAGKICFCGQGTGRFDTDPIGGCVPATCATDADCPEPLLCVAQTHTLFDEDDDSLSCELQFACQSPEDQCAGASCGPDIPCMSDGDALECAPDVHCY